MAARMRLPRTLLVLGRVSNLPTVWSNCLAGWWLGGGWNFSKLPLLAAGASLLYIGGMYLNDAFDADFDAAHRRERPIPSGAISKKAVWRIGLGLLTAGAGCLFGLGLVTGLLGLALIGCILIYDAIHKVITISPVLMAACRFFLYLTAASVADNGVTGWAMWGGFALAFYVVGLSYVAAKESTRGVIYYWPCAFLAAPIVLALLMNAGEFRKSAVLLSAALALWIIRSLRFTFVPADRNVGRTVSGLLAGIVLVDLLAAANIDRPLGMALVGMFLVALGLQRLVPAT